MVTLGQVPGAGGGGGAQVVTREPQAQTTRAASNHHRDAPEPVRADEGGAAQLIRTCPLQSHCEELGY